MRLEPHSVLPPYSFPTLLPFLLSNSKRKNVYICTIVYIYKVCIHKVSQVFRNNLIYIIYPTVLLFFESLQKISKRKIFSLLKTRGIVLHFPKTPHLSPPFDHQNKKGYNITFRYYIDSLIQYFHQPIHSDFESLLRIQLYYNL